jgi:SAM-dependent methyltransferase
MEGEITMAPQKTDSAATDSRSPHVVRWGDLRRLTPFSRAFGFDRGRPVDRYYIEQFLLQYSADIRGRVLEIGDSNYTRNFGKTQVTRADVLDVEPTNSAATLVGDLTTGEGILRDAFDCFICTQALHLIYDLHGALVHAHAALKPGGVLLATVPGMSQIVRPDMEQRGDYWRFTTRAIRTLLGEVFPPDGVTVRAYGNVLASTAFLYGLAADELHREELEHHDPDYELLISVRAVRQIGRPR